MRIAREALTFDDVLLQPDYSDVLPREVDMSTRLTSEIKLNIPLLSAAMDTVTESRLAIALAQEGGIGIIHKNMLPDAQAREVLRVKKFESGIVRDPITVPPDMTIREVMDLTRAMNISGVPVVEGKQTIGIVTHRDLRFESRMDAPVSSVMTPQDRLVTVREGADDSEVLSLLHQHRIEKVLVVNDDFELRGMITAKDFQKATDYPRACKDDRGALRVGAAVGTGFDTDERVAALVKAGVDVVVVDTSHGFSRGVLDRVRQIKQQYPDLQVIGGNIVTKDAALALVKAGADGVKVGIGPGSICTTRVVAGVGVPQISAVAEVAEALSRKGVPLIADGGIRYSGAPYQDLAYAACEAAGLNFDLGTAGAGYGATTANLKGGLGSASTRTPSGWTVAALATVNAVGSVTIGDGPHFWAAPFEQEDEFGGHGAIARVSADDLELELKPGPPNQATTLVIVATDADMDQLMLKRVAIMANAGMARATYPAHTPLDGDIVFALSTAKKPAPEGPHALTEIGNAAAAVVARSIARGIYEATAFSGDPSGKPAYRDRFPGVAK